MKSTPLSGKVALVTGASSGIGEALARELAREGCRVGLLARRGQVLEEVAQEIRAQGGEGLALPADVLEKDQVQGAVDTLITSWGSVDIAVANAGLGRLHRIVNMTTEKVHQIMDLNFYGSWHVFEAVLPGMLNQGSGHLVGISSVASFRGMPKGGPYSASKAALTMLLESARAELRPKGIFCSVIHPGFVHTPMADQNNFKMPLAISADKAAVMIVRSIKRQRAETVIPWQLALVMPLWRALPNSLFDRLAARSL